MLMCNEMRPAQLSLRTHATTFEMIRFEFVLYLHRHAKF